MSERIITLFGEEIVPEPLKPAGKSRLKKPLEEKKEAEADKPFDEQIPGTKTEIVILPQKRELEERLVEKRPEGQITEAEIEIVTSLQKKEEEKDFVLPEEWEGDKQYYSIGEVAELFKVKTSHIRFWTNEFKLKVRTTRKGDRLYTSGQVRELRAIYHLVKERGFTLSGAKAKLKSQNKKDVETIDLKQSLLLLRNKLLVIRNQLM